MVKKILIIFLIVLMFLPAGAAIVPISLASEEIEAYGVAGLMAYLPVGKKEVEPTPSTQCECNKATGKISYDGGTSFTDCPCTGEKNCGCKKKTTTSIQEVKELLPRTVLITQHKSCVWCRDFDTKVLSMLRNNAHVKSGWRVGKGRNNHVQIIDIDDDDACDEITNLQLEYNSLPTLIFLESNGSRKSHSGSMSYSRFIEWAKPAKKK